MRNLNNELFYKIFLLKVIFTFIYNSEEVNGMNCLNERERNYYGGGSTFIVAGYALISMTISLTIHLLRMRF